MSYIGHWPPRKYKADFPLDFGRGFRGDWLSVHDRVVGVFVVHNPQDMDICGMTVLWERVAKVEDEPLTINSIIHCSCGLRGAIKDGRWLSYM